MIYKYNDCTGLTSITIPEGVTSIGEETFSGCSSLTSITIPESVTSIDWHAFSGCSSLTSIIVESGNTVYDSRNDCNAIIETATNTLIAGCQNTIIPNSVTNIGYYAFSGCSSLTSITIPESVTSIGGYAFRDCSGLTNVYCLAEDIPTTTSYVFENTKISSATLHVPAASLRKYQETAPWSGFGTIVGLTEDEIDAVEDVLAAGEDTEIARYDLQGRKIAKQKGINIIRYSDGTSKKVLVK